jgi:hypothetical protein
MLLDWLLKPQKAEEMAFGKMAAIDSHASLRV